MDVEIAIDIVVMALQQKLDVAILASTDTDLKPALEAFELVPFQKPVIVEVAAWRSPRFSNRLIVKGQHIWCHWLEEDAFESVCDRRDYNLSS